MTHHIHQLVPDDWQSVAIPIPPGVMLAQPHRWTSTRNVVRLEIGDTHRSRRAGAMLVAGVLLLLLMAVGATLMVVVARAPLWAAATISLPATAICLALAKSMHTNYPMREPGEIIVEADRAAGSVTLFGGRRFCGSRVCGVRVVEPRYRVTDDDPLPIHVHIRLENSSGQHWEYAWLANGSPTWRLAHTLAAHLGVPVEHIRVEIPKDHPARALIPDWEALHPMGVARPRVSPTAPSQP